MTKSKNEGDNSGDKSMARGFDHSIGTRGSRHVSGGAGGFQRRFPSAGPYD